MDFIVEKAKAVRKDVTVKELINKLLDCNMNDIIIIKNERDEELRNISINARKQEDTLGCLFG